MSNVPELILMTPRGLYCPAGDFYIDPAQPVQTAVVTHGHGDHLRPGHSRYILARPGLAIARTRLPGRPDLTPLDYGAPFALGATRISLHPAGHILGSAQIRIEHEGRVWVVSGDYKRQVDPTCAPFEPLACDVFVTESTFALPIYRWPPAETVIEQILAWWRSNREQGLASVLFCYSLGKAQRILAELGRFTSDPVHVHSAMSELIEVYRAAGVSMPPTFPATAERSKEYRGALVLAPPNASGTTWVRRLGVHSSGFCSGWMRVRGERRRRGYHRGFVISDHADWPALVTTCLETKARRVLTMHGYTDALSRYLTEQGMESRPLDGGRAAPAREPSAPSSTLESVMPGAGPDASLQ